MARMLPVDVYLANLRSRFSPGWLEYMTPEAALKALQRVTGQAFGPDPAVWEAWLAANPIALPDVVISEEDVCSPRRLDRLVREWRDREMGKSVEFPSDARGFGRAPEGRE